MPHLRESPEVQEEGQMMISEPGAGPGEEEGGRGANRRREGQWKKRAGGGGGQVVEGDAASSSSLPVWGTWEEGKLLLQQPVSPTGLQVSALSTHETPAREPI